MAKNHRISVQPFLPSSPSIYKEAAILPAGNPSFGARSMNRKNAGDGRKAWNDPMLHRLTIDLDAIRQKNKGNTDSKGNGAIS
mgnify:CR=1 FL=1